jgi:hypothetical protein
MNHDKDISVYSTVAPYDDQKKTNEYVRHSEVPQEPDVGFQSPSHRSFITKLGLWNIFVLAVGAIASFLAMAFLALLWAGSESARRGAPTPHVWWMIVEMGWATRVVTVASVLIRLATAAQMGIFAALVAAWVLETTGASAEHLPMLSIIRTVNNGPQSHVWNVFHSFRVGTRYFYSTLVIFAILDALALQFTSTLLITDFRQTTVVQGDVQSFVSYTAPDLYDSGAGNIQAGYGVDFYQSPPSTYVRFAEYAEPAHLDANYADSGPTLRAYMPFGLSEDRDVLRGYNGPATVIDTRVRCSRPLVTIHNMTFMYESGDNSNYEVAIAGQVSLEGKIPDLLVDNGSDDSEQRPGFEGAFLMSAVARIYWVNNTDWRLSFTMVPRLQGVRGFANNTLDADNTSALPILMLNATGNGWQSVLDGVVEVYADTLPVGPYNWTQTSNGIWADLKPSNDTLDIGLSATLCFANLNSNNYVVSINEGHDFEEPKNMTWNQDLRSFDTSTVVRMLNKWDGNLTTKDRGILKLNPPANWTASTISGHGSTGSEWLTNPVQNGLMKLVNPAINQGARTVQSGSAWGCTAAFTPFSTYNAVHRMHAAIFQDIMKSTGNPALAFQAFFTIMTQMTYYDFLPQYNIQSNATYSRSEQVEVPAQWIGFGVVMGLLILHAVLITTAVWLFLLKTDHSLLGNAWQAVAQVSSSDTMDTMHHASNMTDLEVKRLLRMKSCEDNDVVLRTGADGGRSQAVYRRGTGDSF